MDSSGGFSWFLWLIVVPIVLAIEASFLIAVSVPVTNVLTRLRANYLPHAVSLDHVMEAGREPEPERRSLWSVVYEWRYYENPKIGPNVRTFWPMAKRVYRLEGVRGLYKGTTLTVVQLFVTLILILLFNQPTVYHPYDVRLIAVERPVRSFFTLVITTLVLLPTEVLICRSMVHHANVSWRHPRTALRQVLSPSEVLHPWRLYLIPGLVQVQLVRQIMASYMTHYVRYWTMPVLEDFVPQPGRNKDTFEAPSSDTFRVTFFGLLFFLTWCLCAAIVLVPVDCILVRLMTQYDRSTSLDAPGPAFHNDQAAAQAHADVEDELRATTSSEPVTSLRPCYGHDQPTATEFGASEVAPYDGVLDCARKMYDEEGSESLMRGATYTIVGYMLMAFS